MPPDHADTLGDRYVLGDVIGRGGVADVYRADDSLLGRSVAVKVLRDTTESESDRLRFTSEARTLAGLSHPGLVTVLDAGITAEQPYLVMELIEGQTLGKTCSGAPMGVDRVTDIGVQLGDALAYAHDQGVIHRDVKPGNVLLSNDRRVKLADFGIARLIGDTVRHTKTGHAIGTAAYLAPEQVLGDDLSPAVDVYSLGLVLLEALTGERSYPGPPTEAALARLGKPPHIPDSLPANLRQLLAAMTALDPAVRPTAAQVTSALAAPPSSVDGAGATRLMTQATPLARQPAAIASRLAEIPPHLRGVIASVIAILLLVVIAGLASNDAGSTENELPSQTPQELEAPLQDLHDAVNGSEN